MSPVRRTRINFPWRSFLRLFFRLCLIGLIVGSCTQSLTWLGEAGTGKYSKKYQRNYRYNDYDEYGNSYHDSYSSSTRNSTRYNEYQQPIEEDKEPMTQDEYEYKY